MPDPPTPTPPDPAPSTPSTDETLALPPPSSTVPSVSVAPPRSAPDRAAADAPLPAAIGRYRILHLLGEGGMGAVYEAEQDYPQRTVALKVIRAGYASAEMLRRFENEIQALGRLQHPGIAQIYDAGAAETPHGPQPYIAMELVRGHALLEYCASRDLSIRARLALFARICDAVQHAHQRGLIHRDLKPANILVDDTGQPRILDFGIARLTDADAQATRQTSMGELIGTLAYMSPEQVSGDPGEVDTRSDVYALGVILYELLAGKGPYPIGRQLHEAVRAIRETEPTALRSFSRTFRGDIETIAGKALEKDKSRRYSSAAEFAADIRRYLHDQPIIARPPSTTYQIRKFARRNKALVSGVAAVFLVLVAGVIVSTREAILARRAQAHAQQETAIAQAVNNFLQNDLLGQASAYNQAKPDPNITVRTVLDRAARNIQGKFTAQPAVEAAIRATIGRTYGDLGLYFEEQNQLRQTIDLSRRALGPNNPQTLALMAALAGSLTDGGKPVQAEPIERQVLAADKRILGEHDRATLQVMADLAQTLHTEQKFSDAEALDRQTLALERRYLGEHDRQTAITLNNLEAVYLDADDPVNAAATGAPALALSRQVFGPDSPYTISSLENLASADDENGQFDQAEALYRQALDIDRRILGPDHPKTLLAMDNLAGTDTLLGNYAASQSLLTTAVAASRRVLGPDHPQTVAVMFDLGTAYDAAGQYPQAHAIFDQVLSLCRPPASPNHGMLRSAMTNASWTDFELGKYAEAESIDNQLLADIRRNPGQDIADNLDIAGNLAGVYLAEGRTAEALSLYRRTLASMQQVLGVNNRYTLEIVGHLAEALRRAGQLDAAAAYATQAWTGRQKLLGADTPDALDSGEELALIALQQQRYARAESLARSFVEAERKLRPNSWQRFRTESLLGESLAAQGKDAEAAPLLRSGYAGLLAHQSQIGASDQVQLRLAREWLNRLPSPAHPWRQRP